MKKQLLCTSAIALGVAAAPAMSQEWDVGVGGYFNQHFGYASIDGAPAGVDLDGATLHTNAEIIFTPSITLDNGMTFGVNIQYEALNAVSIDESYMTISSDTFGQLDVGSENSAGYKMMVGAPGVTSMYINSPSISTFVPFSAVLPANFRQAALSSYTEVAGNNDVARITYYTPDFNGFQLGVSYAPTGVNNAANAFAVDRNAIALKDVFDVGVSYNQSFGTTDVAFAARYGVGDTNVAGFEDPETYGVGLSVGFGAFTVGGSYSANDNGAPGGLNDQEGFSLGATYDTVGPWAFEALTYQGEYDGTGIGGGDEEYIAYRIGGSRDLGPGVSWDIYAAYVEANDTSAGGPELEGNVVGTAINLSF